MEMVNGYVFLDLTKSNVYSKALKVLGTNKPVVIKDGSGLPYFVDSLTLSGTNVVITKGGKTITIANDNTISSEGLVANPTMENIVDLDGNKRFIEGEITTNTISGVTYKFAKWSLSGTHLMIVLSGDISENTSITDGTNLVNDLSLPQWIKDKIALTTYGANRIDIKSFNIYTGYEVATSQVALTKSSNVLRITVGATSVEANSSFRIQFDLLID